MLLWLLPLFVPLSDCATLPFSTAWRTTVGDVITLPLSVQPTSSLNISWGDGQTDFINTSSAFPFPINHTYLMNGSYVVSILGNIIGFRFDSTGDAAKLIDILSWGNSFIVSNYTNVFAGCVNLRLSTSPSDQPMILPGATLEGMFMSTAVNSKFDWNLENVRSVARMFAFSQMNEAVIFSNASGVTDMAGMFEGAANYNQKVTMDTKNVLNMSRMFYNATSFNALLDLNTSKVTSMESMFSYAASLNQPVLFATGLVQTMTNMFRGARVFNMPILFDTQSVVSMSSMFEDAGYFNHPINFRADRLVTAQNMFKNAISFNESVMLSNTNSLTSVAGMFANVSSCFNKRVSLSSTTRVTDMSDMFLNLSGFHRDLRYWDIRAVVNCSRFCPECGVPKFELCSPCEMTDPIVLNATNASVCNLPTDLCGSAEMVDALCDLVQVSAGLQVECMLDAPTPPQIGGGVIISPLFNITQGSPNVSDIVFTLPIDPKVYREVGTIRQACFGAEMSCEWQDPTTKQFLQSGCAVSRSNVDMGSGVVGTECACTHTTVFAIVLRSQLRLQSFCHAQDVDYVLLSLYCLLTAVLLVQLIRVVRFKLHKRSFASLLQHSSLLLASVLRMVYLVAKPVLSESSLAGLVFVGLMPSAISLCLFIYLLMAWASLQSAKLQNSTFVLYRRLFYVVALLVLLLVLLLVIIVAVEPSLELVQAGSYLFAILSFAVCVLVLLSGLGLRRSLQAMNVPSASPASSWKDAVIQRTLIAAVALSVCLFMSACLWAVAVQRDILMSYAATVATTTAFYAFDWFGLCVMTWLLSRTIKEGTKTTTTT